jgi:hypothetical protein
MHRTYVFTSGTHILEFIGESCRFRQRREADKTKKLTG